MNVGFECAYSCTLFVLLSERTNVENRSSFVLSVCVNRYALLRFVVFDLSHFTPARS